MEIVKLSNYKNKRNRIDAWIALLLLHYLYLMRINLILLFTFVSIWVSSHTDDHIFIMMIWVYIYRCLHEIWSAMRYVVCIKFLNKINTKWIHDDECVKHTITATAIFHTIPMLHADYIYEKKKTRQSLYHIRQKKN